MESEPTKHTTLIVFGGALLAVVIIAIVVYVMPRSNEELARELEAPTELAQETKTQTTFNTSVLERTEYKELDIGLFTRGLLPVTPPTGTGKTNLFR